jgi:16S rRNA processing protein RimM
LQEKALITLGEISGVFGIKGWVKVFSFTHYREDILRYSPWLLTKGNEERMIKVIGGSLQGKAVVAQLEGISDRDQAANLMGWTICVKPEQLPKPKPNEYYWSDLLGLAVVTTTGEALGVIDNILETGSNDVLIVKGERERAIPFIQGEVIIAIDLEAGTMVVDWDSEF